MSAFSERLEKRAALADTAVARAAERLATALAEYDRQVEIHEERGDGFFSQEYRKARREAVLAQKFHEAKLSAARTAHAQAAAATLPGELSE